MLHVSLTIGHNVHGVPTHDTWTVMMAATTILGSHGATVINCDGLWMGEAEKSTRIEVVCNLKPEDVKTRVSKLSRYLTQDAIMCEVKPTTIEFLG